MLLWACACSVYCVCSLPRMLAHRYQFVAEGSTLQLPNGALYSSVVSDHSVLKTNLKSTQQTANIAQTGQFAYWAEIEHRPHIL